MDAQNNFSEDELLDLRTLLMPRSREQKTTIKPLRRSPRKQVTTAAENPHSDTVTQVIFSVTSNQRQLSPAKQSPAKRSTQKPLLQAKAVNTLLDGIPVLPRKGVQIKATASASFQQPSNRSNRPQAMSEEDSLLESLSKLNVRSDQSEIEEKAPKASKTVVKGGRSTVSQSRAAAGHGGSRGIRSKRTQIASQFILDEARCEEDLVDSDAQDEGEDEDTDLSGFIVGDDEELSYHEPSDEIDSEEERRSRRKPEKVKVKVTTRKRLQRGRKVKDDSEEEADQQDELSNALNSMKLVDTHNEHRQGREIEVIDLTSPDHKTPDKEVSRKLFDVSKPKGANLFDKFQELKLSPPDSSQSFDTALKLQPTMGPSPAKKEEPLQFESRDQYKTPPATPPRSPTKLRSPSKLLSPSKRGDAIVRSPHRQSMDAFWDLNEVNEWHDQFSPKKAPVASPRKNRLVTLDLWSDAEEEEDSFEAINESSDSLPSPCESPTKSKSRPVSPVKAEKQRLIAEKKAKQAEKAHFEQTKHKIANDLLEALDKNITDSRISSLSSSTGGVKIIWSNTLRSTAGRANWRRTVTKPTGSPIKGNPKESIPGTTVHHYANIELAVKVIDRPDRLINTLAHEFCHLANFMVSGIRDQPHGASFQSWARKVTSWMKRQDHQPLWQGVEVTTKHGYVIEWKYLWTCTGRAQNRTMEMLNIDGDEGGCGAEYGRHSKSVDPETQRCGRCKGRLVQVRPRPRASPVKKGARKVVGREKVEAVVEVVELSD